MSGQSGPHIINLARAIFSKTLTQNKQTTPSPKVLNNSITSQDYYKLLYTIA